MSERRSVPSTQRFRTGELIPYSGIYRVYHVTHRLPHEVTLLDGEVFPRCLKCETAVEFELVQKAPDIRNEDAFRVVLFGLPANDEEPNLEADVAVPAAEKDSLENHVLGFAPPAVAEEQPVETPSIEGRSLAFRRRSDPKEKKLNARVFKPGEEVPEDGLYSVEHDSHRLLHQATLAKQTLFPNCRTCGAAVRFRLVRPVGHASILASSSSSSILENFQGPKPPSAKAI